MSVPPARPAAPPPLAGAGKLPVPPPRTDTGTPAVPRQPVIPVSLQPKGFAARLMERPIVVGGIAAGIFAAGLLSAAGVIWLSAAGGDSRGGTEARLSTKSAPTPGAPVARAKVKAKSKARGNDDLRRSSQGKVTASPGLGRPKSSPDRKAARTKTSTRGTTKQPRTEQPPPETIAVVPSAKRDSSTDATPAPPPTQDNAGRDSSAPGISTLEAILDAPGKFKGQTITIDGFYKIGARTLGVKGSDGKMIGRSIQITRPDGATISPGDGKAAGREAYLLVQEGFLPALESALRRLKFQVDVRALHRSIVTVAVRATTLDSKKTPVVEIVGLEILGSVNMMRIVEGQYDKAFATVRINRRFATVVYGDGNTWVDFMGGEKEFVLPVRQAVRGMQRRPRTKREIEIIDQFLEAELARVMMLSSVDQQRQQTRMFESLMGKRVFP